MEESIRLLSKISLPSKISFVQHESYNFVSNNLEDLTRGIMRTGLTPWKLETFLAISLASKECKKDKLKSTMVRRILKRIDEEEANQLKGGANKWYFAIMYPQFTYQHNPILYLYRYNYYFNYIDDNVDMKKIFTNRFGESYDKYLILAYFQYVFTIEEFRMTLEEFQNDILPYFKKEVQQLTIDRDKYIQELDDFCDTKNDYINALKPSLIYPFLKDENGNIFYATPHTTLMACTESLMQRITINNNKIKNIIGKHVYESYLLKLLEESGQFDNVKGEVEYEKGKMTIDVMTNIGNKVFLFDCKSYTPKIKLRLYNNEEYEKEITRILDTYYQMIEHAYNKYGNDYEYLGIKIDKDRSNIFGVIVLQQNPEFPIKHIFDRLIKETRGFDIKAIEWAKSHIAITSISNIENYVFYNMSIEKEFVNHKIYSDYWFIGNEGGDASKHYRKIIEEIGDIAKKTFKKFDNQNNQNS